MARPSSSPSSLRSEAGRPPLARVLLWFVLSRIAALGATWLGALAMSPARQREWAWVPGKTDLFCGPGPDALLAALVRWDANFYLCLARGGYPAPHGSDPVYFVAFFPGYPALLWALGQVGLDTFRAAFLLSNACALAAALVLASVPGPADDRGLSPRAALLLLVSPGAHFLSYPYPEALFALLLAASLLFLATGRPLLAGLSGGLATATRSAGVVVTLLLVFQAWQQRRERAAAARHLAAAVLSLAGLAAFSLYCRQRYGDLLAFAHIQSRFDRGLTLLGPLRALARFNVDPDYYLVTLASLACVAWMLWKSPRVQALGAAFLLWLPLATGTLKAMIRYQGVNLPLLAGAARWVPGRRFDLLLWVCLVWMMIEAFLFGAGLAHY